MKRLPSAFTLLVLGAAALAAGCSAATPMRRTDQMDQNPQVLSLPRPPGGARFDVTHRPTRDEVGLTSGARTVVVGKSTDAPFHATLATEAGDLALQARDVAIDSEPSDGPVAQLVVQLIVASRSDAEAGLRSSAPVLGLDLARIDAFLVRAEEAMAASSTVTVSTNLRGGTTGGGMIEAVLRYNPNDDTIFENVQVTWLS